MLPKVSILIPCYNAEQWIAEAIDSALQQTYPNKEVIVVDDGSTDNSLNIIKQFGWAIRCRSDANQGGNVARNHLLTLSTGEWLQYLDADDYLLPTKVEKQVACINQHSSADIIYSPSLMSYEKSPQARQEVRSIPQPHDPWILLARWYLPQTGSPLWRKQAIVDVGAWKPDQPCCQEHELYLRLLKANKRFVYFGEAESVYRQWSEETICKKNMPEVYRQRLAIEDDLELTLIETRQMSRDRQWAINQARFECARLIWLFDTQWAKRIIAKIHQQQKSFVPAGASAPIHYRTMYQLMGFSPAERLAGLRRKLATP